MRLFKQPYNKAIKKGNNMIIALTFFKRLSVLHLIVFIQQKLQSEF